MARGYNNPPRELTARFASKCAETGKQISKGDTCIYYPSAKKVYHVDSKTAADFRSAQFDSALGYNY